MSKIGSKQTPEILVDLTKPRSQRPMRGLDIEEWRGELNLSKYDAQYALGFRNSNHYNSMCHEPVLPFVIEVLIRLYEENPIERGWKRYTLRELFDLMYGQYLLPFEGHKAKTFAKVDLGSRFCKLFDRSSARHYQWLQSDASKTSNELSTYADVECVLAKLKQVDNPGEVLERIVKKCWALRGVSLDSAHPIPTLENPPTRQKTGRKGSGKKIVVTGKKVPAKSQEVSKKTSSKGSLGTSKGKAVSKTPLAALKSAVKKKAS